MDVERFDTSTRTLATVNRRSLVRILAGGAAGVAATLVVGKASAEPRRRCQPAGGQCDVRGPDTGPCCSGTCCGRVCCNEGEFCTGAGCCPALQACGEFCCPPESTGCTVLDLPDGPLVGCLCPEGMLYRREENVCVPCPEPGSRCRDGECCDGVCCGPDEHCCDGTCCPAGHTCSKNGCCPVGQLCDGACCAADERCCLGQCIPKVLDNGNPSCCSDAECAGGGGFCCLAGPGEPNPCDPVLLPTDGCLSHRVHCVGCV